MIIELGGRVREALVGWQVISGLKKGWTIVYNKCGGTISLTVINYYGPHPKVGVASVSAHLRLRTVY